MVALSLLEAGDDVSYFQRRLAARLRWWLVAAPPGVGAATARSILKLWLGFPPSRSGVYSAGNGPAMRSALLGLVYGTQPQLLVQFVRASTQLTHTDPKAFEAALAVAVAASCAARARLMTPRDACTAFAQAFRQAAPEASFFQPELARLERAVTERWSLDEFVDQLGCLKGVTGYALHTVPAALYSWMLNTQDFRAAVSAVVRCGGDTDSTAAIVGAIAGAGVGSEGIPNSWLAGLVEWPRNVGWMRSLMDQLAVATGDSLRSRASLRSKVQELAWLPWTLVRNLLMLSVVIYVLFRRTVAVALLRVPKQ